MKKLKEKDMKDETKETQEEELRQTIYTSVILQTHALMRTHAQTHTHRHTHRHTHTPARRGARCCDNLGIQRNQREANAKHKANIEIVGD